MKKWTAMTLIAAVAIFAGCALWSSPVFADMLDIKGRGLLNGKVIRQTDQEVTYEDGAGNVATVPRKDVLMILPDSKPVASPPKPSAARPAPMEAKTADPEAAPAPLGTIGEESEIFRKSIAVDKNRIDPYDRFADALEANQALNGDVPGLMNLLGGLIDEVTQFQAYKMMALALYSRGHEQEAAACSEIFQKHAMSPDEASEKISAISLF